MAYLEIAGLKKNYGPLSVVKEFSLDLARGEFVTLLGPSGCGKTTVLRMIAGFETPSAGRITIDGRDVTTVPTNRRNIGMVFQAYALFPNLTVADNIGFGMTVARRPRPEIASRVKEMLDMIQLPHIAGRFPAELSGGQQQRVALARALALEPKVLLLDEPLSALDAKVRVSLRDDIRRLQQRLGITTIFVTHDQEEALSLSDRIVVMSAGQMEQTGTPFEVYNFPRTPFVSTFVGHLNRLPATVLDPAIGRLAVAGAEIELGRQVDGLAVGAPCMLGFRPEAAGLAPRGPDGIVLPGTVDLAAFQGAVVRLTVRIGETPVSVDLFNDASAPPPETGAPVSLHVSRSAATVSPV